MGSGNEHKQKGDPMILATLFMFQHIYRGPWK